MDIAHIISMLIAPVVMISACGLPCMAFYGRLAVIVSRLRVFHAEQLLLREKLETAAPPHDHIRTRMDIVHRQIETDMSRAQLMRNTLVCLVLCIICMILCSLALGASLLADIMTRVSLAVFVLGQIAMLVGMVFALIELFRSLSPVALESDFVESRIEAVISDGTPQQ